MPDKNNEIGVYQVLVIFDITDNKRRRRITKILNSFGTWIQKSAFECRIDIYQYKKLCSRLQGAIDSKSDSLKVYRFTSVIETFSCGVMLGRAEYRKYDIV